MTTSVKHGNFTESEQHISNEAYRRYLLDDGNSLFDESGKFSQVKMVAAMLAKIYEEDGGPDRVRIIVERSKQSGDH